MACAAGFGAGSACAPGSTTGIGRSLFGSGFVLSGPGIRRGRSASAPSIVDVAPTVLAAAGVSIPTDMDGTVLGDLFEVPPAVSYASPLGPTASDAEGLSDDDERAVTERLRALGYMT